MSMLKDVFIIFSLLVSIVGDGFEPSILQLGAGYVTTVLLGHNQYTGSLDHKFFAGQNTLAYLSGAEKGFQRFVSEIEKST
jgi:hypothetical protein